MSEINIDNFRKDELLTELLSVRAKRDKLQQELGKSKNEVAELNLAMELISKIARTAPQDTAILEVTNCYRTGKLLAQRDLTQQAKGVENFIESIEPYISRGSSWLRRFDDVIYDEYLEQLRQQASELNK